MMYGSTKTRLMTWLVGGWWHVASYSIQHAALRIRAIRTAKTLEASSQHASSALKLRLAG
jgi:hypothetical protein